MARLNYCQLSTLIELVKEVHDDFLKQKRDGVFSTMEVDGLSTRTNGDNIEVFGIKKGGGFTNAIYTIDLGAETWRQVK